MYLITLSDYLGSVFVNFPKAYGLPDDRILEPCHQALNFNPENYKTLSVL